MVSSRRVAAALLVLVCWWLPAYVSTVSAEWYVAGQLGVFDCSGVSDGSAAAILCRAEDAHRYTDNPLYVKALSFVAGDGSGLTDPAYDYTTFPEIAACAADAYAQAGVTDPRAEIAMAEVHDCFTPTALVLMEEIIRERYSPSEWNIYGAQASDGDNWHHDSGRCRELLSDKLLPLCRYYAYVQVAEEEQNLWDEYAQLPPLHAHFAMRKAVSADQITSRSAMSAAKTPDQSSYKNGRHARTAEAPMMPSVRCGNSTPANCFLPSSTRASRSAAAGSRLVT